MVLFTLRMRFRDGEWEEHHVEHWSGYGVVCPSLATTNGSYRYLVHVVRSYLDWESGYDVELVPSALAPASLVEQDLLDSIRVWLDEHAPLLTGPRPTLPAVDFS